MDEGGGVREINEVDGVDVPKSIPFSFFDPLSSSCIERNVYGSNSLPRTLKPKSVERAMNSESEKTWNASPATIICTPRSNCF